MGNDQQRLSPPAGGVAHFAIHDEQTVTVPDGVHPGGIWLPLVGRLFGRQFLVIGARI